MTSAVGAGVGGAIALGICFVCLLLPGGSFGIWGTMRIDRAAIVGTSLFGIPVAVFLGWRLARGMAGANLRQVVERGLTMAVLAVVLGALEVTAVGLATELPRADVGPSIVVVLPYLVAVPIVGLVLFGPLVLLVTVPAGLAWAAIVRLLLGTGGELGRPGGRLTTGS